MPRLTFFLFLFAIGCGSSTPAPEPVAGGECTPADCGPEPAMPSAECPDGTVSGPTGVCKRSDDGVCGWEVKQCDNAPCVKGGCSGQICIEQGDDVMTTCEWQPQYACYQGAACERQSDGQCGWTDSAELQACLADPPAPPEGG
jgi:hypothetical protein